MGFRTGSIGTCWSVEPGKGNYTKVRLSVNRKNKESGQYEQDFSGFCLFIGQAHAKAQQLKPRSRIKLGEVDVSTTYNKAVGKEYVDYKVFDFELVDDQSNTSQRPERSAPAPAGNESSDTSDENEDDDEDGQLPF